MFCANCGKQIENDTKFCEHCGAPTDSGNETKTTAVKINTVKKAKSNNTVIIISAVAGVIILVIIIAILLVRGTPKPSGTYTAKAEVLGFSVAELSITFTGDDFSVNTIALGGLINSNSLVQGGTCKVENDKLILTYDSGVVEEWTFEADGKDITVIYMDILDFTNLAFTKQ